ncbi:valacyclovir hydrolase [Anopheles darlingi]|uniref:valacyclovir hydrolase n=1 Tax=Anopheles darlingi TaxID=43151 RepID=UPI00210028D7|nr:valacyclovir hydrolase [Anopheles darlingi]
MPLLAFVARSRLQLVSKAVRSSSSSRQMSTEPRQDHLRIGSHDVHFVEAGQGSRGLILLPGALGTAWTDFKPQIEKLPTLLPQHKLIAWDPPGYGKSRPPEKRFSLDFFEQDAAAAHELMQKLGFDRYSIAGWSDGGITGMIQAANHPDRVEKLIIWGSNSYISDAETKIYEDIRDVSKWSARMREPMEKVYGVEYFPKLWSAWVDGLLQIHKECEGDICSRKLSKIKAPTLIVHGAKDPMIIPEHVPYLLNNIKNSDIHVFPEGKHNIHLRFADEFNKLLNGKDCAPSVGLRGSEGGIGYGGSSDRTKKPFSRPFNKSRLETSTTSTVVPSGVPGTGPPIVGKMASSSSSGGTGPSTADTSALMRQNNELRHRLQEEANNYRRRLDTYKQAQNNQAALVSRLQAKVIYRGCPTAL